MSKLDILTYLRDSKCVRTHAMVDRQTLLRYCLPCSIQTLEPDDHALVLKHLFIKEPYPYQYRCFKCDKDLTFKRPISECTLCMERCPSALTKHLSINHNSRLKNYCYNHYNDSITFEE